MNFLLLILALEAIIFSGLGVWLVVKLIRTKETEIMLIASAIVFLTIGAIASGAITTIISLPFVPYVR